MANKLAILVSGPRRYVYDVVCSIDNELSDVDYAFFIHIWKIDIGNKKRNVENTDEEIALLKAKPSVVYFEEEAPLNKDEIIAKYGEWTGCPSPVYAIAGMFYAINKLLNNVDSTEFSHVLRVRTDNVFLDNRVVPPLQSDNVVYTASNPLLDRALVCDHLMFCDIPSFMKIWGFQNFDDFFNLFNEANRDPELYVAHQIKRHRLTEHRFWKRYYNYHIVYSPKKPNDPKILNSITTSSIKSIFSYKFTSVERFKLAWSYFIRSRSLIAGVIRRFVDL